MHILPKQFHSAFPIICFIALAFTAWKSLCHFINTNIPMIVVISESMEPAFRRGDLLFLSNRTEKIEVGDVVTAWFERDRLPMVHRVVQKFGAESLNSRLAPRSSLMPWLWRGDMAANCLENSSSHSWRKPVYRGERYMTKGDNNQVDDASLYPPGQRYMERRNVIGCVRGYLPWVGWIRLVFDEVWWLKQGLVGVWLAFNLVEWALGARIDSLKRKDKSETNGEENKVVGLEAR